MSTEVGKSDFEFRRADIDAAGLDEILSWARAQLGIGPDRPWQIVGGRRKLSKLLFEVDENGTRLVGKISTSERAARTFQFLTALWNAGLRPPSRWTVTEPIAWLPERSLLLQRKADGDQLMNLIRREHHRAMESAEAAGQWLHALQRVAVDPPAAAEPDIERCRTELCRQLPQYRRRIADASDTIAGPLTAAEATVPSHGDYHALNVFVTSDGRVTVIDLDTFALREPAADVAYLLAQIAAMGYRHFGNFDRTAELRAAFARTAPHVPAERVDIGIRWAFLRSLHYDFCILKLREHAHLEPFLTVAERGL